MNVAIIPARGGSRRIPRKNIRMFHGKPIIAYSIEAARESGLFDKIIVSTDDDEIASIAAKYGAHIFRRMRDDGTQGTQQVAAKALRHSDADYACCIYATAPLMTGLELLFDFRNLTEGRYRYVFVEGWYYWGRAHDFIERPEIVESECMRITPNQWIDINTEEDWLRAERMYAEQHGVANA